MICISKRPEITDLIPLASLYTKMLVLVEHQSVHQETITLFRNTTVTESVEGWKNSDSKGSICFGQHQHLRFSDITTLARRRCAVRTLLAG